MVRQVRRPAATKDTPKRSKERQGPALGVRFTEVSILERCRSY